MIEVVIIGKNEGKSVRNIIKSLPSEWKKHYIADRCTDNTVDLLKEEGIDYIDTTSFKLDGRQTSFCRNLGLSLCDSNSDVLFLDGDRYLVEGDIREAINSSTSDILLLKLENEYRTNEFFQRCYGHVQNCFFSCGLFIKRDAINKILAFQDGELFRKDMQSLWGIEDTYLGDVCYHLGLSANLCETVKLSGCFEKKLLDSLETLVVRLQARDKLNVLWNG